MSYDELIRKQIQRGIVERFTAADGRPGLRYLKDDAERGIAAGSEILDSTSIESRGPVAPDVSWQS